MGRDLVSSSQFGTCRVAVMQLLLVAYPGAGKGTQATKLAAHYGIAHLSSGELMRAEVAHDTRIGRVVADYVTRGDLVPDEVVFDLLSGPILTAVRNGGYVLDGFPRSLRQAEMGYLLAQEVEDVELQAVIHLTVGRDELRKRLRARSGRQQRPDDEETLIAHRFEVYERETEPLLEFYEQRGILIEIDGDRSVDVVFNDIVNAVDDFNE
jgi:adenylate kinase